MSERTFRRLFDLLYTYTLIYTVALGFCQTNIIHHWVKYPDLSEDWGLIPNMTTRLFEDRMTRLNG